jgi:hypothetical protein
VEAWIVILVILLLVGTFVVSHRQCQEVARELSLEGLEGPPASAGRIPGNWCLNQEVLFRRAARRCARRPPVAEAREMRVSGRVGRPI